MKKFLAVILALVMTLSMGAGVAMGEDAKTITGWGALNFSDQIGITSYSQQYLWQAVEERLGIKVDWTTVPQSDKQAMFSLVMADPANLPAMFVDMDPLSWEEFGRMGALQALNDYITPEVMPNLCALIAQDPEIKAAITSADGNIYFPRIMEAPTRYWCGYFIREDFLEACGLEVPATTEEFYNACTAIKEKIDTVEYPISMNSTHLKDGHRHSAAADRLPVCPEVLCKGRHDRRDQGLKRCTLTTVRSLRGISSVPSTVIRN